LAFRTPKLDDAVLPITALQTWTPYCGEAPDPAALMGRWNLDPVLLLVLAAAFASLWIWRTDRTGRMWLIAAFGVLAIVFVSPLCALSSALFASRTLHHILLVGAAAPMLAMVMPRRRGRLVLATAAQAVVFWGWHAPDAYAAAMSNNAVYWLMQVSLLGSAVWFWSAARAASAPAAVTALLAAMLLMGLLGALITFAGQPVYAPHFATTLVWGLTPLEDQQAAGLIMWAPAALLYLFAALWRTARMIGPPPSRAIAG